MSGTTYHVTLKAVLSRGSFYWVCDVTAASEDEAITAAEHLFMAEVGEAADWTFGEFNAEPVASSG